MHTDELAVVEQVEMAENRQLIVVFVVQVDGGSAELVAQFNVRIINIVAYVSLITLLVKEFYAVDGVLPTESTK